MAEEIEDYRRDESEAHTLDRNYSELLQELRVAETGVQLLFAFLLAIAFQQRFGGIDAFERTVYVVTLISAALAAAVLIAPVALHRALFRRRRKDDLVDATARLAGLGLVFLAIAMVGSVLLVLTAATNRTLAIVLTAILAVIFIGLWGGVPMVLGRRPRRSEAGRSSS